VTATTTNKTNQKHTMKTEKTIKLKTGETLPKGLPVSFVKECPSSCLVHAQRDEPFRVRVLSAFHPPSLDELQDAVNDGICPSVAGDSVEPDGWDSHGSPSWLLALGMI
jgi:hypothetical protein